jgi:hypothetical protein
MCLLFNLQITYLTVQHRRNCYNVARRKKIHAEYSYFWTLNIISPQLSNEEIEKNKDVSFQEHIFKKMYVMLPEFGELTIHNSNVCTLQLFYA